MDILSSHADFAPCLDYLEDQLRSNTSIPEFLYRSFHSTRIVHSVNSIDIMSSYGSATCHARLLCGSSAKTLFYYVAILPSQKNSIAISWNRLHEYKCAVYQQFFCNTFKCIKDSFSIILFISQYR